MSNYVNPNKNNRQVERSIFTVERMCIALAGIITSIGFFVFGKSTAAQYTSMEWVQYAIAGALAVISFYATDLAFKQFLEKSIYDTFAFGFHWKQKVKVSYLGFLQLLKWVLLTTIVGAFIWADYKSVYVVRDPFADSAKQLTITNKDSIRAALSTELAAERAELAAAAKESEKTIKINESRVERGNKALVSLKEKGNGWAEKQLSKQKDKATKADRAAASKYKEAGAIRSISDNEYIEKRVSEIDADNQKKQEKNDKQKAALTSLFTMFGFGTKITSILCRFFLVISFLIKTKGKVQDIDGDGDVDGDDVTAWAKGQDQPKTANENF